MTSTDPTGGANAWSVGNPVGGGNTEYEAISCPSTSLCVIGGEQELVTYTASGGQDTNLPANVNVTGVSCPTTSLCVATYTDDASSTGSSSGVLTSTDPTGGASAWTMTTLLQGSEDIINSVSCPSVSLCVATASNPSVTFLTSADPTGGASAWSRVDLAPPDGAGSVSCSSPTLCAAIGGAGMLSSTDPAGGAGTWSGSEPDPERGLSSVSCVPGASTCVAVDSGGNAIVGNEVPASTLAVTLAGTGSGSVGGASSISCPGTCSGLAATGTTATLVATPAPGSYFAGWSSECTGTVRGICNLTMAGDQAITATFNESPPSCTITPSSAVRLRRVRLRRRRKVTVGTLGVSVRCDQAAGVAIDTTVVVIVRAKTKHRPARTRSLTLAPGYFRVTPGISRLMTLKLTQRAVNYLTDGKHEAARLSFFAHDANGISRGSRSILRLHAKRG